MRPARDAGSLPRLRNPSGSTDQTKVTHSAKTISVPISSMLRPPASTWRNRVLVVRPPLHAGTCPCAMTTASPVNCEKWENSPQPRGAQPSGYSPGCRRVALTKLMVSNRNHALAKMVFGIAIIKGHTPGTAVRRIRADGTRWRHVRLSNQASPLH